MKKIFTTISVILLGYTAVTAQRNIDLGVKLLTPEENANIAPFERVYVEIEISNNGTDSLYTGDTIWYNHSQIPLIAQKAYILEGNIPPNATANLTIDSFANSDQPIGADLDYCVIIFSPDKVVGLSGFTYLDTNANNNEDCNKIKLQPTAVSELQHNIAQLNIYPNPAQDVVNIEGKLNYKGEIFVSIFDITGKEIISSTYHKTDAQSDIQLPLNVSKLSAGMYFVQLYAAGNKVCYKFTK